MTARLKKNYPTLKLLHKAKPKFVKAVISNSLPDFIHCLADCCHNLLKSNIHITKHQKKRLEPYKRTLRKLTKSISVNQKWKVMQRGGFLSALLSAVIPTIAGIVSSLVKKGRK